MTRSARGSAVAFALCLSACSITPGTAAERTAALAHGARPHGAAASVTYRSEEARQINGELIAVRTDGLFVLSDGALMLLPYPNVLRAEFPGVPLGLFRDGGSDTQRRTLAGYARYPSGFGEPQLTSLLSALGQGELIIP